MTRAAMILLWGGTALFVVLLALQGFGSVFALLLVAGWGIVAVAAFHLVPLVIDAWAIQVLFDGRTLKHAWRDALLARWAGESVNSLLPAGQIGGPVLMARHLAQRGLPMSDAAAAITVSTTLQTLAQIVFALFGLAAFFMQANRDTDVDGSQAWLTSSLVAVAVIAAMVVAFFWAQRRGLFGRLVRLASKLLGRRDWSALATSADAIDAAIASSYRAPGKLAASFALSFVGWVVGTVEVWLALRFLGHPVGWHEALLLESVGQAIRGAAFAIPGSLGVQEGGYLLLAPLVGLPPEAALAVSLVKRARELVLGAPGLLYLHLSERSWRRRVPAVPAVG